MIRRNKSEKEMTKLEKRVSVLDNGELVNWADQALFTIGRNISAWDKTGEYLCIEEANSGAEALSVVISELVKRSKGKRNF